MSGAAAGAKSPVPLNHAAVAQGAKSPVPLPLSPGGGAPIAPPPKLVRQLSVNSTKVLESAFGRLDKAKSGWITAGDAKAYFESVAKACNASESAAMMMAEFDDNSDGKISFDEWAAFFKRIQVPEQTLEAVLIGMGFAATVNGPTAAASASASPAHRPAVANASAAAAADSKAAGGAKSPLPIRLASPTPLPPPKLVRQLSVHSTQVLVTAFAKLDTAKSGFITAADAKRYFESVVKACNASESAAMMMAEFDENADNKISFDEWAAFFKRIQVPEQTLEAVLSGMGF